MCASECVFQKVDLRNVTRTDERQVVIVGSPKYLDRYVRTRRGAESLYFKSLQFVERRDFMLTSVSHMEETNFLLRRSHVGKRNEMSAQPNYAIFSG